MSGSGCGRYMYCVVKLTGEEGTLGRIGLDGNEVYPLLSNGLAALVHNCGAEPYGSEDDSVLRRWVVSHQQVVEAAQSQFGVVLPMRFNTIVRDTDERAADINVRRWLASEGDALRRKLEKLSGHDEYGVQVFWDPRVIASAMRGSHPELARLEAEIRSCTQGTAYMYRQRLDRLLRQEVEKAAQSRFTDFHRTIKRCVSDLRVERTRNGTGGRMLMNVSCLVPSHGIEPLSHELEKIDGMDGFETRLTGPWPPYSFATD